MPEKLWCLSPSPDPSTFPTHSKPGTSNPFTSEHKKFLHDPKSATKSDCFFLLALGVHKTPRRTPGRKSSVWQPKAGQRHKLGCQPHWICVLRQGFVPPSPLFPKTGIAKIPTAQSCGDLFNKIYIQVEYS